MAEPSISNTHDSVNSFPNAGRQDPESTDSEQEKSDEFGRKSRFDKCQFCKAEVWTNTTPKPSKATYIAAIVLCCIPFIRPEFQDIEHSCPKCKEVVGISERVAGL